MYKVLGAFAVGLGSLTMAGQVHSQAYNARLATPEIPAQPLESALQVWAQQSGWQLMYESGLAASRYSSGVPAGLPAIEGLTRILEGTGLEYQLVNERTISILPGKAPKSRNATATATSTVAMYNQDTAWLSDGDSRSASAQTSGGFSEREGQDTPRNQDITEVVVTAQKRAERLQDVPVPVTSIGADALVESNLLRLEDYYARIPGVSMQADGFRGSSGGLIIRGLQSGGGNPTVGVVIDDVPYGSSTAMGGGGGVPDIDPNELSRIEVLRGPQGTLYGVSSLGGLLKYVTVDPSTDGLSGRVQAGLSNVYNGDDLGYNVRGSVNVPLSDTWAVRASAFTRQDPGYVDDPVSGQKGLNEVDVSGGRLSALWRPSTDLSLKLSALIQDTDRKGLSRVDLQPALGDLEQTPSLPGSGQYEGKAQAYSATLSAKFGNAELVSLSGYNISEYSDVIDLSSLYAFFTQQIFNTPNTLLMDENKTTKFTQEVRLSTPLSSNLDWLVGAFYTHEKSDYVSSFYAADDNGAPTGFAESNTYPTNFNEYAGFTDLTWKLTDQFDVQFGGRQSENHQNYENTLIGPYVPVLFGRPTPLVNDRIRTSDSSFTYLVTPRYKISPDLMVYARLASGYRAGGPNFLGTVFGVPPSFEPDKTKNYEIGVKGNILERTLAFDASVYYIDWSNIALSVIDLDRGSTYQTNASGAKSQGIELSLEARPISDLTISTSVAWNTAELTDDFPATSLSFGVEGDRLPLSAKFTGTLSIDDEFAIWNGAKGFVGGSISYIGERQGGFTSTPVRPILPAYAQTDVRTGVRYESWTVNLFVNNLTDRRGVLAPDQFAPTSGVYYIQPRTLGASLSKTF